MGDEMVRLHFLGKGRWAHKASTSHMLLCMSFLIAQLCCWVGWAHGSLLATVLLPLTFWLLAVNVSHDASHFAFSSIPWVNELCCLSSVPLLYEPITWYQQHVVSHHTHCNEVSSDVDLQHFVPLKLHTLDTKSHPTAPATLMDYTKIAAVGLHLAIGVPIAAGGYADQEGYKKQFSPSIDLPPGLAGHRKYRARSLIGPAAFFIMIGCCIWYRGVLGGIAMVLPPYMGASLLFVLCTQVSHIQPEVQKAELAGETDFFKHQALTSVDYSTDSHFWRIFSGGLNTQALHHCLPYVSSCHYTDLHPAFNACCLRHGVVLNRRRSLYHAACTGLQHVWSLNRPLLGPISGMLGRWQA